MGVVLYAATCPEGRERETAYGLLALALERELGVFPMPEIARQPGGKPCFPHRPEICFNLSHSRGAAVCALSDRPVGVDVERLRTPPRRLGRGMAAEEFFRLWTAREATVKREGRGIAAILAGAEPAADCCAVEGLLPPAWVVSVCPGDGVRQVFCPVRPRAQPPDP